MFSADAARGSDILFLPIIQSLWYFHVYCSIYIGMGVSKTKSNFVNVSHVWL